MKKGKFYETLQGISDEEWGPSVSTLWKWWRSGDLPKTPDGYPADRAKALSIEFQAKEGERLSAAAKVAADKAALAQESADRAAEKSKRAQKRFEQHQAMLAAAVD